MKMTNNTREQTTITLNTTRAAQLKILAGDISVSAYLDGMIREQWAASGHLSLPGFGASADASADQIVISILGFPDILATPDEASEFTAMIENAIKGGKKFSLRAANFYFEARKQGRGVTVSIVSARRHVHLQRGFLPSIAADLINLIDNAVDELRTWDGKRKVVK